MKNILVLFLLVPLFSYSQIRDTNNFIKPIKIQFKQFTLPDYNIIKSNNLHFVFDPFVTKMGNSGPKISSRSSFLYNINNVFGVQTVGQINYRLDEVTPSINMLFIIRINYRKKNYNNISF